LPLFPVVPAPKTTELTPPGTNQKITARSAGFRQYGGAFRIHLRRGWYSRGESEQLGIMLVGDSLSGCNSTQWEADPLLSKLFTRWGPDPIWSADAIPSAFTAGPLASDFMPTPGFSGFDSPGVVQLQPYELQGLNNPVQSQILVYNPVFRDRDGWYCDVILKNVPAYNTFLRLALVRYQAKSIDKRKVSLITLAPFIQLHSDYAVRVLRGPAKRSFFVAVYGVASGSDFRGQSSTFQLVVEMEHHEMWICDGDSSCAKCAPAATGLPLALDGTPGDLALLATYSVSVTNNTHRRRRIRVNQYEMRTGYDPRTLQDDSGSPFWTSFGRPVPLP
jgi:hypothetical protein